ncbi:helix-turn-helix domain-containing protein [Tersicoccus sp. MR15.9]|uniref:helix-turn-helix domain-containing protein n=1 Tax=Tersicoccus mangrovi TaxID=3121635 RepID=UPI002FE67A31
MSVITVSEAGRVLGISRTAVRRLIERDRLTVTGRSGKLLLLDEQQVRALAETGRRRGRPWAGATAWAALCLLSGQRADWLNPDARSRLRAKLRRYTVEDVHQLARHRATVSRWIAPEQARDALPDLLTPTGDTALADPAIAADLDLEAGPSAVIDGYTTPGGATDLADGLDLTATAKGGVILRDPPLQAPFAAGHTPAAAVTLDLMDYPNAHLAAAGADALDRMLSETTD